MRRIAAAAVFISALAVPMIVSDTPANAACAEQMELAGLSYRPVDDCEQPVAVRLPAQSTTTSPPSPPTSDFDRVVTFGDSYSSGTGIHRHANSYDDHGPANHSFSASTVLGASTCYRELQTTPGPRIAADEGAASVFVACRGAVVSDIPNQMTAAAIPGTGDRTLVTITIGGNDVLTNEGKDWPDLLEKCIFQWRCYKKSDNQIANWSGVQSDLQTLYTIVGNSYPDATVRVLGYPEIMQRSPGCSSVTGISRNEADWFDDQVKVLNSRISSAVTSARNATGADIQFVSVESAFNDRGACRSSSGRWVNDKVLGQTYVIEQSSNGTLTHKWVHLPWTVAFSSFHPTQSGYDAYYQVLKASI